MKKNVLTLVTIIAIATLAISAFAATTAPPAPVLSRVNVPLTVPKKAKSVCTTIGAGRAATTTLAVTQTSMVNWKAFSATDGTAVTVKRSFDANSAYVPSTGEDNLPIGDTAISNITFTRYSGAATVTVCSDRN